MRRLFVLAALAGCGNEIDPAWQLDHERIIAVRATPPHIASGEASVLDALRGHKGGAPTVDSPDTASVESPASLAPALKQSASQWVVYAPSAGELAAARTELGLAADAPVPLRVQVGFSDTGLDAFKIVWLGEHADNPALGPVSIDGVDATTETELSVPAGQNVPLEVGFDDTYIINWLTSCGTMHDFDLAKAYLRVEAADPHTGSFAIVVRDSAGGVAWQLWPITAQ